MKITAKAPRKKNYTVQCKRCQCYRHIKTYCTRLYTCVTGGGKHNTTLCTKNPILQQIVPYAEVNYPANYKGCDIYKNL